MSTDNRTVATDALATLGTIIGKNEKRDAIHLAVEPVVAGERLWPGNKIIIKDGAAFSVDGMEDESMAVGIVDPFLKRGPQEGDRFWLVVMPRQITSLRHVWEHPSFPPSGETLQVSSDFVDSKKEEAELWIRNYINTHNCPGYDVLIAGIYGDPMPEDMDDVSSSIRSWGDDGDYLHFSGTDAHGEIDPKLFDMVEIVTGRPIPNRPKYFSCSC